MEEKKSLSGLRPCSVAASEGGDDRMKVVDVVGNSRSWASILF